MQTETQKKFKEAVLMRGVTGIGRSVWTPWAATNGRATPANTTLDKFTESHDDQSLQQIMDFWEADDRGETTPIRFNDGKDRVPHIGTGAHPKMDAIERDTLARGHLPASVAKDVFEYVRVLEGALRSINLPDAAGT